MKIFKKLASVMIALPVLAALTACDNDNDYDPAEKLTNQQVFFSNELKPWNCRKVRTLSPLP